MEADCDGAAVDADGSIIRVIIVMKSLSEDESVGVKRAAATAAAAEAGTAPERAERFGPKASAGAILGAGRRDWRAATARSARVAAAVWKSRPPRARTPGSRSPSGPGGRLWLSMLWAQRCLSSSWLSWLLGGKAVSMPAASSTKGSCEIVLVKSAGRLTSGTCKEKGLKPSE